MEQLRLLQSCLAAINESEGKTFQKQFALAPILGGDGSLTTSSSGGKADSNTVQELMKELDLAETDARNQEARAKESEEAEAKLRHRLAEVTQLHSETLVALRQSNTTQTELRAQVHEATARAQTVQTLITSWNQESIEMANNLKGFADRFIYLEELALRHQQTADQAIATAQKLKTTLESVQRRNSHLQARICELEEENIRLRSRDTILSDHVTGLGTTVATMKQIVEAIEANSIHWNKGIEATQQSLHDFFLHLDSKLDSFEAHLPQLSTASPVSALAATTAIHHNLKQQEPIPSETSSLSAPAVSSSAPVMVEISFDPVKFWGALVNQEPQFAFSDAEVQEAWNLCGASLTNPTENQPEPLPHPALQNALAINKAQTDVDHHHISPDSWLAKLLQIISSSTATAADGGSRRSHPQPKDKPLLQGTTDLGTNFLPLVSETISDCREIHQLLDDHHKREVYISLLELQLSRVVHRLTHPQNDHAQLMNAGMTHGVARPAAGAPSGTKGPTRQRRIVRHAEDDGLLP